MANSYTDNVIFVDTSPFTLDAQVTIQSLKYRGNTNGTAVVRGGTASDAPVYYENDGADDDNFDTCIRSKQGIRVEVTNGATIYLYLK